MTVGVTGGPVAGKATAEFDGTTSYAQVAAQSVDTTRSYSVAAWVRLDDLDANQAVMVMNGSNGGSAFKLRYALSGSRWWVEGAGRRPDQTVAWWSVGSPTGMPAAAVWTQLVVTVEVPAAGDSTIRLYVNGSQAASVTTSVPFNNPATNLRIGTEYDKWFLDGRISEVATFPAALTAGEVEKIFAARGASDGSLVKTVTVTDPASETASYVYDLVAGGRLIYRKDTRDKWTRFGYDTRGFMRTVTDPNGNTTVRGHDVRGNVVSYSTCQDMSEEKCSTIYLEHWPNNTDATLAPDPRNDVATKVRDGRSASKDDNTYLTTYAYNAVGDVTTVTDPLGRITTTTYSDGTGGIPSGLPVAIQNPSGATQTMEYATTGDMTATVDTTGRRTEFTRDGLGQIVGSTEITDTYPAGLVTSYTYDKAGRVLTRTDPAVLDRITSAVHTPRATITYDEDGREQVTTITDLTGGDTARATEKSYNTLGQLAWTEDALNRRTSYTYNAYGKVATRTGPDGVTTAFTYDAMGNPLTRTVLGWTGHPADPQPATDLLLESRAYDPAGRLATVTDAMGWQTKYTYTNNNLLATVARHDPSTSTSHTVESYKYDGAGNPIESLTNNGATKTTAVLDPAARVVSQTVDPAGVNRTTTFTYNVADNVVSHRVSDGSGASQRVDRLYDRAGRLLGETTYPTATGPTPVGRWQLNESSGTTAADEAGNARATLTGAVTWSSERSGSASFDGVGGSVISTAGPVLDTTRSHTVSVWVKPSTPMTWNKTAVSQDGVERSAVLIGYRINENKWGMQNCAPTGSSSNCVQVLSTSTPVVGEWVHLVGVYDAAAAQIRLYVNGQLQGTAANTKIRVPATGPLRIGRAQWGGVGSDHWTGLLDDAQVYQEALTDTQVQAVYTGTAPGNAGVVRTSWTVDQRGLPTSQTDGDGDVTYYDYDEAGRLAVATYPPVATEVGDGSAPVLAPIVESAAFNTFGEVVEARDGNGRHTFAEYDDAGQLSEVWLPSYTPPGSSTPITPVRSTFYDEMGRVVETRDELGNPTLYGHDQLGRTTSVEDAEGGEWVATYSPAGHPLTLVDPTGAQTETTYDFLRRPLTRTEVVRQTSQSYTSTFTYNPQGWLATSTRPGRVATSYTYNSVGELVRAADGAGNVAGYTYDYLGRRVSSQRQHTSCEPTCAERTLQVLGFDGAGRQVDSRILDAANVVLSQTSAVYDKDSLPVAVTNPRGATSTYSYDALGRMTGMVEPVSISESITTSYGYDATGALTRFTDGRGSHFRTTYNVWGLPETKTEPGGATFTTSYDAAGRPVGTQLPGGVTTTSTYDKVGRLTAMSGGGAEASTATRTFGFDLAGRMTSISGPGGTNTLTYDDRGLPTSVAGPSGDSSYAYTPDGLLAQRVDAAGTTDYAYDTTGRVAEIKNVGAGLELDYQYDTRSQVSQITYGGTGNRRLLQYDPLGRVETDEVLTSTNALVGRITYGWDDNSNLTSKATVGFTGSAVNAYTYDLADRLTSWNDGASTTETYAYDASGNRTQIGAKTFTYNSRNQLVSSSDGSTYSYTPRGTLASVTTPGVGTLPSESDAFGQLIRQYDTPSTYTDYSYDGLGRVLRTGFEYTGLGNDLAADPAGTYVRGPAGDLVGVNTSYAWTDLHTDVVAQFGATSTTLTGSTTYNPFGAVLATNGMQGSLGYQSEYTDAVTGKVNMHARWYNPDTGQFDNRDLKTVSPAPNSAAANRYAYAGGNPLVRIDPTGHDFMSGCSNMMSCIVQGFVNSFDIFSVVKKLFNALGNIEQTVRNLASSLKADADYWKGRIRNILPGFGCWIVGNSACNGLAFIGGWTCAMSGVCAIIDDCAKAFTDNNSRNNCGQHIGEALAEVVMAVLSGGAATAAKISLKSLIDRFKLPDRRSNDNRGGGSNNNGGGANNGRPNDNSEHRDGNRNNGSNNNSGGSTGGGSGGRPGGRSGGGSSGGNNKPKPPPNPHADKPPTNPIPPAPRFPGPVLKIDASKLGLEKHESRNTGQSANQSGSSCEHSFDPTTKVLLADGTTKAIKDVKVGDEVVATNPATGETTSRTVTNLHVNLDRALTTLTLTPLALTLSTVAATGPAVSGESGEGDGGRSTRGPTVTLRTTQNHPLWDATTASWVDAADLVPGQSVVTGPDGQLQLVVAVDNFVGASEMRDLTVATTHTYYVIAGDTPVLVHNCGTGGPNVAGHPEACSCAGPVEVGQTVFRVAGRTEAGGARPWGQFWSRVDPRTVPDYRDAAGLPLQNPGRFLLIGRIRGAGGVEVTPGGAVPLGGTAGGIDEIRVPYPSLQIRLSEILGLNPEM